MSVSLYIVNPLYTDTGYDDKIVIVKYDWHEIFAQELTVNQKIFKNYVIFILKETYVFDIC